MSNRIKSIALLSALLLSGVSASALDGGSYGSFTPYSVYGLGDIFAPGTAYNWTMGGVGVASRNNRYLNITNPAAVTARDSLAFMSDFSAYQNNRIFRQGDAYSAANLVNMLDCAMSFPITRHSAMALGIKPFSSTGYGYSEYLDDPVVIAETGNVGDAYYGQGSVYQIFATAGVTLFRRLSLGASYIHYFGDIEKTHARSFSESAALDVTQTTSLQLNADAYQLGLQYSQPIGSRLVAVIGGTYRSSALMGGYLDTGTANGSITIASSSDTLRSAAVRPCIPSEWSAGLSVCYMDKLRLELDWSSSDWTSSNFSSYSGLAVNGEGGTPIFSSCRSTSWRFGAEYIPNINDIRYYRRKIAYRAGFCHKNEGYTVLGSDIVSNSLTFGVTLPVFRWYNGITLGCEAGRRGTVTGSLVRETFINFSLGVNLFDIWFQQPRYE